MSWNSGPMIPTHAGRGHISADVCAESAVIADVDVRAEETLAALAVWRPGVIRTLRVLEGELRDSADLPPEVLHGIGVLVRRIGEAVMDHATTTADPPLAEEQR